MKLPDRYVAVHNVGLLQRQAGVDREVAELVQAFARLRADAGQPIVFEIEPSNQSAVETALYRHFFAKNPNADERFLRFLAAYGATIRQHGLPPIYSTSHLARLLGVSPRGLQHLAAQSASLYREIRIPKANGKVRRLLSPQGELRRVQNWIQHRVLRRCTVHEAAQAFVRKRSIVTNARAHENRRVVLRIDLEDFFPSVPIAAVRRAFQRLGYPYSVARLMAAVCTVEGGLPQGAPTSPSLSNLVNVRMDQRFTSLSKRLRFSYTRYADDLVISSDDERLPSLLPFFREVIRSEGYRVNEPKTRVMRRGTPQVVTGLVTNVRAALKRTERRRLRAAVHRLRTKGPAALVLASRHGGVADPLQVLRGHLAFMEMVRQPG